MSKIEIKNVYKIFGDQPQKFFQWFKMEKQKKKS